MVSEKLTLSQTEQLQFIMLVAEVVVDTMLQILMVVKVDKVVED